MQFDAEKFKKAILYIIWKAGNRKGFGATKLNKVLWFADSGVYLCKKRSITGATYIREKYGPVPKQFVPTREALVAAHLIEVWKEQGQTHFRTASKPIMSQFADYEMAALDYWIENIDKNHTAESISDESHDWAWQIAREKEELPLYARLVERIVPASGAQLDWAREEAEKLGLQ